MTSGVEPSRRPGAAVVASGLAAGLAVAVVLIAATTFLLMVPPGVLRPLGQSSWWVVARFATVLLVVSAGVGIAAAVTVGRARDGFSRTLAATMTAVFATPLIVILNVRHLGAWGGRESLLGNAGAALTLLLVYRGACRLLRSSAAARSAPPLPLSITLLLVAAAPGALAPRPSAVEPLHGDAGVNPTAPRVLLLITVDTLRADHLGCYGRERAVSPRLDRLAADGVRYDRVIAQAPNTHPSLASMHSGLPLTAFDHLALTGFLARDMDTLAARLRRRGYETFAVVSNPYLRREMGFDQGFDHYDDTSAMVGTAEAVSVAAMAAVAGAEGPLFLWVHYLDPHHPYLPPPAWRSRFGPPSRIDALQLRGDLAERLVQAARGKEGWIAEDWERLLELYDAEIASTDAAIGLLLDGLESAGRMHDARVVVTADHGEEFRDHGSVLHSHSLYRELVRIPLLRWPRVGAEPAVRSELLAATAVEDLLTRGDAPAVTEVLSEKLHEERHRSPPLVSIRTADGTLIVPAYRPFQDWTRFWRVAIALRELCLFAPNALSHEALLAPDETTAAPAAVRADLTRRLRRLYRAADRGHRGAEVGASDATREELRGLGYLH